MVNWKGGGSKKPSGCNFRQEGRKPPLLFLTLNLEASAGAGTKETTRGPQHVFRPYNVDDASLSFYFFDSPCS